MLRNSAASRANQYEHIIKKTELKSLFLFFIDNYKNKKREVCGCVRRIQSRPLEFTATPQSLDEGAEEEWLRQVSQPAVIAVFGLDVDRDQTEPIERRPRPVELLGGLAVDAVEHIGLGVRRTDDRHHALDRGDDSGGRRRSDSGHHRRQDDLVRLRRHGRVVLRQRHGHQDRDRQRAQADQNDIPLHVPLLALVGKLDANQRTWVTG